MKISVFWTMAQKGLGAYRAPSGTFRPRREDGALHVSWRTASADVQHQGGRCHPYVAEILQKCNVKCNRSCFLLLLFVAFLVGGLLVVFCLKIKQ